MGDRRPYSWQLDASLSVMSPFTTSSREANYIAQAVIETFFWRLGDVIQAAVVFVGSTLAFSVRNFAEFNIVLIFLWPVVAWPSTANMNCCCRAKVRSRSSSLDEAA